MAAIRQIVVDPDLLDRLVLVAALRGELAKELAEFDEQMRLQRAAILTEHDYKEANLLQDLGIVLRPPPLAEIVAQAASDAAEAATAKAAVVKAAAPAPVARPRTAPAATPKARKKRSGFQGDNAEKLYAALKDGPNRRKDLDALGIPASSFHTAMYQLIITGRVRVEGRHRSMVYYKTEPAATAGAPVVLASAGTPAPAVPASSPAVAKVAPNKHGKYGKNKVSAVRYYGDKILEQLRVQRQDMDALAAALMMPPSTLIHPMRKLILAGKVEHVIEKGKTLFCLAPDV